LNVQLKQHFFEQREKILRFNSYICRSIVLHDELEVPKDIVVRGFIIDSGMGALEEI
jgi:hypothetical protein